MLREPNQSHVALLSNADDKHVVTLFILPDCILSKGTEYIIILFQMVQNTFVSGGSQEMFTDTVKQFLNTFICRRILMLAQPLSAFTLVAENTAISLATLEISKLTIPPLDEKVESVAQIT